MSPPTKVDDVFCLDIFFSLYLLLKGYGTHAQLVWDDKQIQIQFVAIYSIQYQSISSHAH